LFANISSSDYCLQLNGLLPTAHPQITNSSFLNFHGNSSAASCFDYRSSSDFSFSDCSFRNITNFHFYASGAIFLFPHDNAAFTILRNQFIDITSTLSAIDVYSNCSYLAFEENSFVNITVVLHFSVFFFFF
jgi:hypothetical protein